VDLLVENRGRSCYGNGMEIPTTGIDRWVQADGQALPGWTIYPLGTMANVSAALATLWAAGSDPQVAPAFYRGNFFIAAGHLADTYLNLQGWGKGMAYINGRALARYNHAGPQFTHYCPSGFLREGNNELILFETVYSQANRTVSFMTQHLRVGGGHAVH
jgi:beta-galactosidase